MISSFIWLGCSSKMLASMRDKLYIDVSSILDSYQRLIADNVDNLSAIHYSNQPNI